MRKTYTCISTYILCILYTSEKVVLFFSNSVNALRDAFLSFSLSLSLSLSRSLSLSLSRERARARFRSCSHVSVLLLPSRVATVAGLRIQATKESISLR